MLGTYMGSREQLALVASMMVATGVRPVVDSVHALEDGVKALRRLAAGEAFGKVVLVTGDDE